ncbi:MAG: LuxR C-terminal-related transcriptional regulator [Gemmatimonadales bacterium]
MRLLLLDHSTVSGLVASAEADSGALREVSEGKAQVVLVDAELEGHDSPRAVERIKQSSPETRVAVMNFRPGPDQVVEHIAAGASGFILKGATVEEFVRTIRLVADGFEVVPPALSGALSNRVAHRANGRLEPEAASVQLTRREQEVIRLIAGGLSNKEIAQGLHIATNTVKGHVHNILEKLALHTRLQVSVYAHRTRPGGPASF